MSIAMNHRTGYGRSAINVNLRTTILMMHRRLLLIRKKTTLPYFVRVRKAVSIMRKKGLLGIYPTALFFKKKNKKWHNLPLEKGVIYCKVCDLWYVVIKVFALYAILVYGQ